MKCAVVDQNGAVVNVIIADPTDRAPLNCILVATPDDSIAEVDTRWTYDGIGFVPSQQIIDDMTAQRLEWNWDTHRFQPNAELQAEMDAQAVAAGDQQP